MTLHQSEAFLIVAAMLGLFVWGGLRHDIVALLALAAALLTGVVPADKAFLGFANPVIIIIASVLVLSRAITISGVIELAIRGSLRRLHSTSAQIGALTACVAILSAFMKNVGALGIFMPIAIQTAERAERSPSAYLMPLAFGSLIGGTITQIGTSPNLLISVVRQDFEDHPFALFDCASRPASHGICGRVPCPRLAIDPEGPHGRTRSGEAVRDRGLFERGKDSKRITIRRQNRSRC